MKLFGDAKKVLNLRFALVLLAGLIVLVFFNVFKNDRVLDDIDFITRWIPKFELSNVWNLLQGDTPNGHKHVYRPIRSLFYLLSYGIWNYNYVGYHLQGILIHTVSTALVYLISAKILKNQLAALFSATFFGVHPLHVEPVVFIAASFDNLGSLFFLLSLYFYAIYVEDQKKLSLAISWLSALFAYFSYEITLFLPMVIVLYDFVFRTKKNYLLYALFFAPLLLYIYIRTLVGSDVRSLVFLDTNWYLVILTSLKAFWQVCKLLALPLTLSTIYTLPGGIVMSIDQQTVTAAQVFRTDLIWGVVTMITSLYIFVRSLKKDKILGFGIGFSLLSITPFLNGVLSLVLADRYLYLTVWGFSLIVTQLCLKLFNKIGHLRLLYSLAFFTFLIGLLVFYGYLAHRRVGAWRDQLSITTDTYNKSPRSAVATNALASTYEKLGDFDKAIELYNRGLEISSTEVGPMSNLAGIYIARKDYVKAKDLLNLAIKNKPNDGFLYYNLGLVLRLLGENKQADAAFEKANELGTEIKTNRETN